MRPREPIERCLLGERQVTASTFLRETSLGMTFMQGSVAAGVSAHQRGGKVTLA